VELLDGFLTYLSVEKGLSRNTLESYSSDLRRFNEFLKKRRCDFASASGAQIVDFLETLGHGGYSLSSIGRYISSIKALYRYMLVENIVDEDPAENIQSPRKWERLPKALSITDVMELLETEPGGGTGLRDSAMLELIYSSGLRVS
jgi:integrase/recombinase XerD